MQPFGLLVGGHPFIISKYMAGQEQKLNPETTPQDTDAGVEARANDIIEALADIRAWQDGERKAGAEAEAGQSQPTKDQNN
ncbi:MAG: hypothetical protein WCV88_05290 [Patescibacteria group bacterium]|jgi:hypothetical protein